MRRHRLLGALYCLRSRAEAAREHAERMDAAIEFGAALDEHVARNGVLWLYGLNAGHLRRHYLECSRLLPEKRNGAVRRSKSLECV